MNSYVTYSNFNNTAKMKMGNTGEYEWGNKGI
jgi:hypothetical protein